jgi:hydrogenase nickel incorporation protein HypA/HybF
VHELGITLEVIAITSEKAGGAPVKRIVLEVGKLSLVLPEALRSCFEICRDGTPLESAELEIIEISGRARCRRCADELPLEAPFGLCACGSSDLEWLAGDELRIREMELA